MRKQIILCDRCGVEGSEKIVDKLNEDRIYIKKMDLVLIDIVKSYDLCEKCCNEVLAFLVEKGI